MVTKDKLSHTVEILDPTFLDVLKKKMVTKDKLIRIVEILGLTFYEVHTIKNGYIRACSTISSHPLLGKVRK